MMGGLYHMGFACVVHMGGSFANLFSCRLGIFTILFSTFFATLPSTFTSVVTLPFVSKFLFVHKVYPVVGYAIMGAGFPIMAWWGVGV